MVAPISAVVKSRSHRYRLPDMPHHRAAHHNRDTWRADPSTSRATTEGITVDGVWLRGGPRRRRQVVGELAKADGIAEVAVRRPPCGTAVALDLHNAGSEYSALEKWLAEVENRNRGGFLGVLQKAKGKRKEKQPNVELPPAPKKTRFTPPECSPRILDQVSIDDDPIFRSRWKLRRDDLGMPNSQMYASGSKMLSRFEMARQVAADEAQLKREAVTKARDQGIRDFLDGNAGDEWLKKRTQDGLEIYELGFAKANEMFAERFPDIPLDDFVLPAVVSPSGEIAMPSEAGDAAAFHLRGEGPSGDAPEALDFLNLALRQPNRQRDQISPGTSPLNRPLLWPPKPRCGRLSCLLYVSGVGACRLGKTIGQFGEVKARPGSF
ncbi:hypothetical protein RJ640_012003 [Escallonia rubra]|uniref:Uncharacterized protein n=1 Tax=Escallonia rubra TaxID=112253 RepID=A0AA88UCF9_9ASTE|nr:hypothetical protein RJ640_012003 [Escallonia rubra]